MAKDPSKCHTPFCKNKRVDGRFCGSCKKKKWRLAHPLKACYEILKNNAKRRGKEFTITFRYFCRFVQRTNYMKFKGKSALAATIDRKDNTRGYIKGNIQCLTLQENSRKSRLEYTSWYRRQQQEYYDGI